MLDEDAVKTKSERIIRAAGGRVCDWLPCIEQTQLRSRDEIVERALVVLATFQLALEAPTTVIEEWIRANDLQAAVSAAERATLFKGERITPSERADCGWYVEVLWAFMWAGGLADNLHFNKSFPDEMALACPNLAQNEDGAKFRNGFTIRGYQELYGMRDLYYRLHWHSVDSRFHGLPAAGINEAVVYSRRYALEWIMDVEQNWDDVEMST